MKRFLSTMYWLRITALLAILGIASNAHAAKIYVDNRLGEVKAEELVKTDSPATVQFAFEFQTDGVRNLKAEKFAKPLVLKDVQASGLFAEVSDAPTPNAALLTIVINNISEKGAAGKGFKAGLTFGLAGIAVTDRYEIKLDYQKSGTSTPISALIEHAIHMTMGKKEDPALGTPVKNAVVAFEMMARQSVAHGLNKIAADPAFSSK